MKINVGHLKILSPLFLAFVLIGCTPETTETGTTTDAEPNTNSTNYSLSINVEGGGSVINLANNVNCETGSICTYSFEQGTSMTLMATAEPNYAFDHWEYSCNNENSAECLVTMNENVTITAVFIQQSGSISLSWQAPSAREDGSPLSVNEIMQYVIYYRESQDLPYADASTVTLTADETGIAPTELIIDDLKPGKKYYFAGVTIDTNGITSQLSEEIMKVVN